MADMEDGSAFVVTWRRGEQVVGVVSMVYDRERAAFEAVKQRNFALPGPRQDTHQE